MRSKRLSLIILTFESFNNKGKCLLHCLTCVINQELDEFEVIIVDNGIQKTESVMPFLSEMRSLIKSRGKDIDIVLVSSNKKLSKGAARNLGAAKASSDWLVFLDDDAIIATPDALKQITDHISKHDWGCGAVRIWTLENSFQSRSTEILCELRDKKFQSLFEISGSPKSFVRSHENVRAEERTFIGHFGFCNRKLFVEVGGFGDFEGIDSCEDDYLQMKLFMKAGLPCILADVTVVHVNHEITTDRDRDFAYYFSKLVGHGIFEFDSQKLIFGESGNVLKLLETRHFDEAVERSYTMYLETGPLNKEHDTAFDPVIWKTHFALTIDQFARMLHKLLACSSLDQFIKNNDVDFDNVAPLIDAAIQNKLLLMDNTGKISGNYRFSYYHFPVQKSDLTLVADSTLNQFPCDTPSRKKRVEAIKSYFPFTDFLRIGIIGDDDLISNELVDEFWIYPVVLDFDKRITDHVLSLGERFFVKQVDFSTFINGEGFEEYSDIPRIHTFITDPPYTIQGTLCFIIAGLLCKPESRSSFEFFVVLNPMILGYKNFETLLGILSDAGILLTDVKKNFSSYRLPRHFKEYDRAKQFCSEYSIPAVQYSSTSNLYCFSTIEPNVKLLVGRLKNSSIYNHYEING